MIKRFNRQASIRSKLIGIILLVTVACLLVAFVVVVANDIKRIKQELVEKTSVIAQTVGDYSVIDLAFVDKTAAAETLSKLEASPDVLSAVLHDNNENMFAAYGSPFAQIFTSHKERHVEFAANALHLQSPIFYRDRQYGSIYLVVSTQQVTKKINNMLITVGLLLIGLIALSLVLANKAQALISKPILELAKITKKISRLGDYSIKVSSPSNDEIGVLYDGFNTMLQTINEREKARDEAEEALFQEKERAQVTLHSIGDGVVTTDAKGNVAYINPTAEQLTGWPMGQARGRPIKDILYVVNEFTGEPATNPVLECLRTESVITLASHNMLISRAGRQIAIEDSAAPIRDRTGKIIGAVVVFHDVSQERQLRRQLSYQASHDSLTGLANRNAFDKRLKQVIESTRTDNNQHAVLYLDLDQFKIVNDTCGHIAGDDLLRQLTALLKERVRETDMLARLGGDEFGVLLERCDLDHAGRVAEILRETIRDFRFVWKDKSFDIGVSIGLVLVTSESEGPSQVMSEADIACYAAKDLGRNRIHVYAAGDADLAHRHTEMQWVTRITAAFEENRFRLYCQPIVPVGKNTNEHIYYEILLRLIDENGHLVPPGTFIPAAERYNIMPTIDRWVLRNVLAEYWPLSRALVRDSKKLRIAINLSGTTLNDNTIADYIRNLLTLHKVRADQLCFEITETSAILHLPHAIDFIRDLKKLGCLFALDDFGSGLSSFGYLKNLPVDFIKIDGSFVRGITDDPVDYEMVKAINQLGHVMHYATIAESVENEETVEKLKEIGVDFMQGYGIAEPTPLPVTGNK